MKITLSGVQAHDAILVGAGPIGIELAAVLQRLGADYVHLEAGQIGQTISWYPKQVRFFSSPERIAIAGVPLQTVEQEKASREEYLAYLRGIVQQFDLAINTYERATEVDRADDRFVVRTQRGSERRSYAAPHLILAIGDMHSPRLLHIPGEDLPHVDHYFDEPHRYFRQKLLIVGGKNSAVEAAIRCQRAGVDVAISYRRGAFIEERVKYWLLPEIQSLIHAGKVAFHPHTVPTKITPDAVTLAPVDPDTFSPIQDAATTDVPADFVLLLTGYRMDTTLFEKLGAELEPPNMAPKVDPETMMTTVPGLYVAGTAAAGTQERFRLFIENCHPHVARIAKAVTGRDAPPDLVNPVATHFKLPES